jgi:hypothetical protein
VDKNEKHHGQPTNKKDLFHTSSKPIISIPTNIFWRHSTIHTGTHKRAGEQRDIKEFSTSPQY